MSYKNPYAKPNNPYSAAASSSSSASTPYVPPPYAGPAAVAGPTGYPGYPTSSVAVAGPSIPVGYGGYDANAAQQASIYTPDATAPYPGSAAGGLDAANGAGPANKKGKPRTTVLRKGGGEVWEDQSLLEWDPAHFRLFIGDLDPAISDDAFQAAFSGPRFPSFVKSKVIRDKYTNKGRGYGFVSYTDPEDFLKAWKEMNGKYVGTRPVTIKKATAGVQQVNIGAKKARMLESKQPSKTGTTPYERANAEEAGHRAVAGEKGYGPQRSRKSYIRR
ncbi:hypothetical protein JCM3766R1_005709 [Sporobolomyces carnicolor]